MSETGQSCSFLLTNLIELVDTDLISKTCNRCEPLNRLISTVKNLNIGTQQWQSSAGSQPSTHQNYVYALQASEQRKRFHSDRRQAPMVRYVTWEQRFQHRAAQRIESSLDSQIEQADLNDRHPGNTSSDPVIQLICGQSSGLFMSHVGWSITSHPGSITKSHCDLSVIYNAKESDSSLSGGPTRSTSQSR